MQSALEEDISICIKFNSGFPQRASLSSSSSGTSDEEVDKTNFLIHEVRARKRSVRITDKFAKYGCFGLHFRVLR